MCALSPDRVLYAGNNGCLWRRGALEDLGGYTQDTDMFALLAERRAKVAVSLSARLHHATSASFGHFLKKRAYYASVSMMRGAEARPFEWLPAGRWRHARFALQVAGDLVTLPHAITAVVRACRERRALWLFHPVAMAAVTWTYVFVACGSWRRLKSALVKLATNGLPGRRGSASHG